MKKNTWVASAATVLLFVSLPLAAEEIPRTASADGTTVVILEPKDGATVESPVTVIFKLDGMQVSPAGVPAAHSGHHHLIVDAKLPVPHQPIPSDENHIHFGGGQTQVELALSPGKHTLQLLLGDHNHVPHDPPIASKRIEIKVKPAAP